ncbi:interleukin-12 subunit beta [Acipenser oxyrinchus oxyrinchus]|uniref:Interleukin-12 subunit beta n=2 Tax=Acipenser oxyrinchus oxyrinchus TaxID=40147 RepID=A0AAD8GH85_ACIOX|nr:interleukin-12 subunit beta [Acipenser oxyrinchus oxyrinchus]
MMWSGSLQALIVFTSMLMAHTLHSFPQTFRVGKEDGEVTLTCSTQFQGTVTWRHDDDPVPASGYNVMSGHTLRLHGLDSEGSPGNYTCWGNDQLLDHSYLVLEEEEEEEEEDEEEGEEDEEGSSSVRLSCSAKTYSCSFHCIWRLTGYDVARVKHQRSEANGGSSWDLGTWMQDGFHFHLSDLSSPFTEEDRPIRLTAEALSGQRYKKQQLRFFLREIIEPDAPEIKDCVRTGDSLHVSVEPPSSWAKPHSYFPLEPEVEYEYKDDGKIERSMNLVIPKDITRLRVRARDPYFNSSWSKWTPWKKVKKGRKVNGQRKKSIRC